MPEMPYPGKDHRDAAFIRGLDNLLIGNRASGLDDGRDPVFGGQDDSVFFGKEGVRSQNRAGGELAGFLGRDEYRIHPGHLARADTYGLCPLGQDNGIALGMLGYLPGKDKGLHFFLGRFLLSNCLKIIFIQGQDILILGQGPAPDPFNVLCSGRALFRAAT